MGSLILAILGGIFVFMGLMPFFGWLNYIGIILLIIGLVSGISASFRRPVNKIIAIIGTILCVIMLFVAIARLVIGGGFL